MVGNIHQGGGEGFHVNDHRIYYSIDRVNMGYIKEKVDGNIFHILILL